MVIAWITSSLCGPPLLPDRGTHPCFGMVGSGRYKRVGPSRELSGSPSIGSSSPLSFAAFRLLPKSSLLSVPSTTIPMPSPAIPYSSIRPKSRFDLFYFINIFHFKNFLWLKRNFESLIEHFFPPK